MRPTIFLLAILLVAACAAPATAAPTLASRIGTDCTVAELTPRATSVAVAAEAVLALRKKDRANFVALITGGAEMQQPAKVPRIG
jgi:hypothetical protein